MKKILSLLLIIIVLASICTACAGNVSNVKRTKVNSEYFTQEEIDEAIDVILDYFKREFVGATLNEIRYVGDDDMQEQYGIKPGDSDIKIIILDSTFTTGGQSDGSLEPNTTYDHFTWTLRRQDGGNWTHSPYEHGF